jgi:hypothetical protein
MTFLFLNVYIINIYIQKRKGAFSSTPQSVLKVRYSVHKNPAACNKIPKGISPFGIIPYGGGTAYGCLFFSAIG